MSIARQPRSQRGARQGQGRWQGDVMTHSGGGGPRAKSGGNKRGLAMANALLPPGN